MVLERRQEDSAGFDTAVCRDASGREPGGGVLYFTRLGEKGSGGSGTSIALGGLSRPYWKRPGRGLKINISVRDGKGRLCQDSTARNRDNQAVLQVRSSRKSSPRRMDVRRQGNGQRAPGPTHQDEHWYGHTSREVVPGVGLSGGAVSLRGRLLAWPELSRWS